MIYCKESIYIDKLMKQFGLKKLGFNRDLKDLKKRLIKLDYKELEKKTLKAREDFDMDKNFPRLEKFIKKVVESKKVSPHRNY